MKKILSLFVFLPIMVVGQTQTENYVKNTTYKVATATSITTPSAEQATQTITYFDGLGRPIQQIAHQQSGSGKDIVTPIEYDGFGRQDKEYLPYVPTAPASLNYKPSALTDVLTYYDDVKYDPDFPGMSTSIANPSIQINPYSQKGFEASPLNRVLKQGAPGKDWKLGNGHEIKLEYETNTSADLVRRFGVSFVSGNTEAPQLQDNGVYDPSQLYKTITKDENWVVNQTHPNNNTTEEFKDKQGQVILKRTYDAGKWHDTYYVYDDYGNLTYVLPPKASTYRNILQQNWIGKSYIFEDVQDLFTYVDYNDISFNFTPAGNLYIFIYAEDPIIQLNSGLVMNLDFISPSLPDVNLGNMYFENGNLAGSAYIQSGNLYFNSSGLADTVSDYFYGNLVVNLQNFNPPPISQKEMENLVYQYKYDSRNRLIEKKLPGKGWEYIVYDKLDRPILTQDVNLKTTNKWLFTKYDAFSRPVYTGEYVNTTAGQTTRVGVQALADASTNLFETKQGINTINGTIVYYSNNAFPNINNTNINLFTINYYDDYNFDLNGGTSTVPSITNAKGLATGSKIRILDTTNWTTNVSYYDSKSRPIYTYSKNDYLATTSTVKSQFDFVGKVLETTSTHQRNNGTVITTVDSFTYDNAGRLLKQTQAINGVTPEVITENVYDELGQLIQKNVGGKTNQNHLQTVNYTYNIRGWLKGINDNDTSNNAITMGSGDLFGFQINYNNPSTGVALYNGNISQTFWKTASTNNSSLKNYNYSYDALNRFKTAHYAENNVVNNKFDEMIFGYDRNGNIEMLRRNMQSLTNSNSFSDIDYLTYTYDIGNKLREVKDAYGLSTYGKEGFKDGSRNTMPGPGDDYSYDANGNMIFDANKGITSITYNHLNLPKAVYISDNDYNFGSIVYVYDAMGTKLKKTVNDIGIIEPHTYYAGNYVYEGNNLKFFNQPEGYIEPKNESDLSQGFNYIYQYKDHLGNVRLSYKNPNDNYQSILNSQFSNSFDNWGENGSVGSSLENGKLKVNVNSSWEGVVNYLTGFTTAPGENLKINVKLDKGNTLSKIRIYFEERDANGNFLLWGMLSHDAATGSNSYDYTVASGTRLVLRIDKDDTNTSSETYFYVDEVSMTKGALQIIEENNYYPFGLKHKDSNNVVTSTNPARKYMFNGKEFQKELELNMYDYGARNYDPALGRWMNIDPHSENYYSISPYVSFANNPVFFIDPTGEDIMFWQMNAETGDWEQVPFNKLDKSIQQGILDFGKTKDGYAFLANFANAGDKIGDLKTFEKDGKYSEHRFNFLEVNGGEFTNYQARSDTDVFKNYIDFNMRINKNMSDKSRVNMAETIGHETFLHFEQYMHELASTFDIKGWSAAFFLEQKQRDNNKRGYKDHLALKDDIKGRAKKYFNYITQLKTVLNPNQVQKIVNKDIEKSYKEGKNDTPKK
ncbi:DUF6443 domain-containing protein [Flavobacterium eburneipallidum]|uniref:DUF6443 domain-containing protein n=1 Tax=Flavobacterium eburneipallidum TaxID=3003263 RepID=UPI002482A0E9|nr:DUF6443 domain-containing protein [Flavobacterium eburneipallidum]